MRISFVTLFPEMLLHAVGHSILWRASEARLVSFDAVSPREFARDNHRTVDDNAFGGGPGMVMLSQPIAEAIESLDPAGAEVVFFEPTGEPFNQDTAHSLAKATRLILVCGHYEGIDERVIAKYATHRLSIGDFVLTGGELPALVLADAVVRLLPGALGSSESLEVDSHSDGLLSAPQFTRPADWESLKVPDVLVSGDHGAIAKWRRLESLRSTRANRPDLFWRAQLSAADVRLLEG